MSVGEICELCDVQYAVCYYGRPME